MCGVVPSDWWFALLGLNLKQRHDFEVKTDFEAQFHVPSVQKNSMEDD